MPCAGGTVLASSPTWYCGNAIDSDSRGILYFVGNCSLFLLDFTQSPPSYVMNLVVCRTRAVGVSVCRAKDGSWRCVTAGDGKIRLWNLDNREAVSEHQAHKGHPITCVQWSAADSGLIVSADGGGNVVAWRPELNTCEVMCPADKVHVSSIACSPHHATHVAVGYKDSTVLILDVKSGHVIQRMRGHDEEIHGLAWCPVLGSHGLMQDDAENENECLLASGSKDRSVRVWSAESGRCVMHMYLPPAAGARREKGEDRFGVKLWVAVHWPENTPTRFITSSYSGEILEWNLAHSGKHKHQVFSQTREAAPHKRIVFNLATGGVDGNTLCSVSMDRQIVLWDVRERKSRCNLATLGGFAYCVEQSPINPGHVAVGCGDHVIRVWSVENPHSPADANTYWQGLKSKVTALSWHPVLEGKLAYGTDDGRVGVYDLIAKHAKLSSTFHKGTVYTVTWGPRICAPKNNKKNESESEGEASIQSPSGDAGRHGNAATVTWCVYSCGDGRVLQHTASSLDKPATNPMPHLRTHNHMQGAVSSHSEVRWKPDYSAVAIGNDDGSVYVFGHPSQRLLCTVHVQRTLINALRWHPQYTVQSDQLSMYRHWLAIASNGTVVKAVDLTHIFEGTNGEESPVITQAQCELAGHSNRVTGLSWSMHREMCLASVSYDHTVQIWDVGTGTPLVNYRGHTGRLLCVQFSDLDPDLVYSGGQDNTLHCWQISKQQHTLPPQQGSNANSTPGKKRNKDKKKNRDAQESHGATSNTHVTTSHDAARDTDMAEISRLLEAKKRELSEKLGQEESGDSKGQDQAGNDNTQTQTDQSASRTVVTITTKTARSPVDGLDDVHHGGEQNSQEDTCTTSINTEEIIIRKDGREKKKKRHKSLFPTSSIRDNRGKVLQHEDCITLAQALYTERPESLGEEWFHLGHLLDRRATHELYRQEISYHVSVGNWEQLGVLEMFRGNVASLAARARDEGHLSDWLLGMSPVATTAAWRDLCAAYATQLGKDGHYQKAATYLLAANQVYAAITVLRDAGLVKDAVCLARMRLAPQDPVIAQLFSDWATTLARDANLELAAKCYLAIREPLEAARCLAKRPDPSATLAATMICVYSGHVPQARVHVTRLMHDGMAVCDWSTVQRGIKTSHHFQALAPLLYTHELLVTHLTQIEALTHGFSQAATHTDPSSQTDELPSFVMTSDTNDAINPWPVRVRAGEQCFAHALTTTWCSRGVCLESGAVRQAYDELRGQKPEQQGVFQLHQVVLSASYDVTLGLLQALLGDGDLAAMHWSLALASVLAQRERHLATSNAAMATQCQALAEGLCQLMLPTGPSQLQEITEQMYALAVTINQHSLATSVAMPFTLSNHHNNGDGRCVNKDCKNIGSWDSLQAYYSYCVLLHWQSKPSSQKTTSSPHGKIQNADSSRPRKIPKSPTKYQQQGNDTASVESNLKPMDSASRDSVEDIVTELEANANCQSTPSEDVLLELSRNLLWDIQVEKFKIKDSLAYIKKAVASLVSKNRLDTKSVNSDSFTPSIDGNWRRMDVDAEGRNEGATGGSEEGKLGGGFLTPWQEAGHGMRKTRAMSGEYIPMDRGRKVLFRGKPPHLDLIQSNLESNEEADDVEFVGPDPDIPKKYEREATAVEASSGGSTETKQYDVIPRTETVYEKALSIFSDDLENVEKNQNNSDGTNDDHTQNKNESKPVSIESDSTNVAKSAEKNAKQSESISTKDSRDKLIKTKNNLKQDIVIQSRSVEEIVAQNKDSMKIPRHQEDIVQDPDTTPDTLLPEEEFSDPVYLDVPEEWYLLPVDEQYGHACASLGVLSREQERLETRMKRLDRAVKELPFPDPFESARLLVYISTPHTHQDLRRKLRAWTLQHGYLSKHRQTFSVLDN